MSGTGNTFSNDLLALIFEGSSIANVAVNATTAPITSIFFSLHTADPTTGSQVTSESTYTGYLRVGVIRSSAGFTISGETMNPIAAITFPACSAGTAIETESFAGIGSLTSAAGLLFFAGSISPTIAVSNGVTPSLTTASQLTLS